MAAKVIVGMSGGVDSSVSALRLLEAGYEVSGLFMKNWDEDDGTEYCTAREDLADAQEVCDRLGIPLHTVNFASEYWDRVFEVFLTEYAAGRTPNPDILCNQEIKFRAFLDYAEALGADLIATGHYARNELREGSYRLIKGDDPGKDQTYFIYTLGQSQLAKILFPVGDILKDEVRKLADQVGFGNARKRDSTGICFIGERKFKDFLMRYLPAQPGLIETADGQKIGEHEGLMYYTLGQRRGFGVGGVRGAGEEAWYVLAKDLGRNALIVGQGHDHPMMLSDSLIASQLSWTRNGLDGVSFASKAKVRYRQEDQSCHVEPLDEGRVRVRFDHPQRAVTPGQSVVFYQEGECLGGGIIETALWKGQSTGLIGDPPEKTLKG
ncbi:MAG TPA: tRNA 2-thiouridine(34) synthase MnmA [Methylococcaceae bacterium]|jgi:tRNA-specific 2-thiouridylase|nr:tRNA 2-thiouridine(34) synthase MnmA [Methylococcaceae bacterium]